MGDRPFRRVSARECCRPLRVGGHTLPACLGGSDASAAALQRRPGRRPGARLRRRPSVLGVGRASKLVRPAAHAADGGSYFKPCLLARSGGDGGRRACAAQETLNLNLLTGRGGQAERRGAAPSPPGLEGGGQPALGHAAPGRGRGQRLAGAFSAGGGGALGGRPSPPSFGASAFRGGAPGPQWDLPARAGAEGLRSQTASVVGRLRRSSQNNRLNDHSSLVASACKRTLTGSGSWRAYAAPPLSGRR